MSRDPQRCCSLSLAVQDPDERAGRDEAEHGGGGLAQQLEEEGRRRDSGLRQRHPVRGIVQTKYFPIYL
jgi:hypothetical protein